MLLKLHLNRRKSTPANPARVPRPVKVFMPSILSKQKNLRRLLPR